MADDQSQWDVVSNTPLPPGAQPAAPDQSQWDVVSNKPSPGSTQDQTTPPTWSQRLGITNPVGKAATDVAEGVVAGGASSLYHAGDWIRRAAGMPRIINQPEVQSAMTSPPGLPGTIGKAAEQVGEFFLPAGAVGEGEKLIEGAKMLPGAVKWVAKTAPEALSAAGVTGAQTGGDPNAIKWAAILAGGTKLLLPAIGKVVAGTAGRSTGVGMPAVEKAAEGSPEFMAALRGETSEKAVLENVRNAAQAAADDRAATYRQQLAQIPQNIQLNLKGVRNDLVAGLRAHGINWTIDPKTNQVVLDFTRSPSIATPGAEDEITSLVSQLKDWGSRPGDFSPLRVDALKQRLDALYRESSNPGSGALILRVRNQIKNLLNANVPGYTEMTSDYARASDFLDDVKDLSLKSKNDGTAIRKLATSLKQNNNFRRDILRKLSEFSGRDLEAEVAGGAMSSWTPRGLAGVGLGGLEGLWGLAAGSHTASPWAALAGAAGTAAASSPRLVGEAAALAGRNAPYIVPKVAGALPSRIYVRPPAQYTMPDTQAQGGTIVDRWPGRKEQLRALGTYNPR